MVLGGAGPGPGLGICGQAGGDGVGLNVGADAIELSWAADPMVKGFVLPEMLACAMQNGVGIARGYAFESVCNRGERDFGSDQQVDVIGHDDKSVQIVEI